jgi:hypothetical protein
MSLQVSTTPKSQSINVSYDDNGKHPRVLFSFHGLWSANRNGKWAANGKYEFTLDAGTGRRGSPRKLILDGMVCEEILPEERPELAKHIKAQLKPQIVALLELVNGDVKQQVHKIW